MSFSRVCMCCTTIKKQKAQSFFGEFSYSYTCIYIKYIYIYTTICNIYIYMLHIYIYIFYFSIWVFFHEHSRITRLQAIGENISLTPQHHFHPLHRHLDISWAITAERSPVHITGSRTRTRTFGFWVQVTNH